MAGGEVAIGAWGAAPWDNDAAWDFVDVLTDTPARRRAAVVVAALDSAAFDRFDIDHRPLDPDAPGSPTVLWARRVPHFAILAVHDLALDTDGRLAPPTHIRPRYPH